MDWTLAVNPGSSSKKYALFAGEQMIVSFTYERTEREYLVTITRNRQSETAEITESIFDCAVSDVLERIAALGEVGEVTHVAVRVVAPGDTFQQHQKIDDAFVAALVKEGAHAPLHIPVIVREIKQVVSALPKAAHWAISDSAFHATVPDFARQYSLAGSLEAGIRRYGYHGISVGSVMRRVADMLPNAEKVVVIHLGSGVSVSGVVGGKSRYNSMGFTPGSGLLMGSRAGDMDPGALISLLHKQGLSGETAHMYLQTKGGFAGWTGATDLRAVLAKEAQGDRIAHAALQAFFTAIAQQVTNAAVACSGVDAIVFTGTAAERNPDVRSRVMESLRWLGFELDHEKNTATRGVADIISPTDHKSTIVLVPTNELHELALQMRQCSQG